MSIGETILQIYDRCSDALHDMSFAEPVAAVYNPLQYAREPWARYLHQYGNSRRRVLFLGMNPGPWGMAQTGVPFGEIAAVRDWMGINEPVSVPEPQHPKRPISGFACERSEVSGRRLWGLFQERFTDPPSFFTDHIVLNYCPLVFMSETGRNITPDKLSAGERHMLFAICDDALARTIDAYKAERVVGIGVFAQARAQAASEDAASQPIISRVLHPSPASPAANRGWAAAATAELLRDGIW